MQHDAHVKAWRQYCKNEGISCWSAYVAGRKAGAQLADKVLPHFRKVWLEDFEGTEH